MEMPSAATSTDSRRATGERRTFEMKPTSQAWQAAERASVATVDSVLERELGFHRQIQPHGDLLRLQNPRVLEKPNLHHLYPERNRRLHSYLL